MAERAGEGHEDGRAAAEWKPKLDLGADMSGLVLSPEEGFLASRMDGATSMADLVRLTGLPEARVVEVVDRLAAANVLADVPTASVREAAIERAGDEPGDAEPADDGPTPADNQDSYRLYKSELEPLPLDARVELAGRADGPRLHALCHDPSPRVAQALLENGSFGLDHARRLAAHHRSGAGLEAMARKPEFLSDLQVQRQLFRNPQVTESILRRIFGRYRLSQVYQLGVSHDVFSKVRDLAKKAFRQKFPESSAEERVSLILKTEGRCLALLVGVALGGKATALLARRPLTSTLLIRNLAGWPSTTPPVLENMARQPLVRRSPQLAGLILQHPNAPSHLRSQL